MSETTEKIIAEVDAKTGGYESAMGRLVSSTNQVRDAVQQTAKATQETIHSTSEGLGKAMESIQEHSRELRHGISSIAESFGASSKEAQELGRIMTSIATGDWVGVMIGVTASLVSGFGEALTKASELDKEMTSIGSGMEKLYGRMNQLEEEFLANTKKKRADLGMFDELVSRGSITEETAENLRSAYLEGDLSQMDLKSYALRLARLKQSDLDTQEERTQERRTRGISVSTGGGEVAADNWLALLANNPLAALGNVGQTYSAFAKSEGSNKIPDEFTDIGAQGPQLVWDPNSHKLIRVFNLPFSAEELGGGTGLQVASGDFFSGPGGLLAGLQGSGQGLLRGLGQFGGQLLGEARGAVSDAQAGLARDTTIAGDYGRLFGGAGTTQTDAFTKLIQDRTSALGGLYGTLSDALSSSVDAAITGSESIGHAAKRAAASALEAIAAQAIVKAGWETAEGVASLALGPIGGVGAGGHFAAAGLYAGVALAAGAGARAMGAGSSGGGSSGAYGGAASPGAGATGSGWVTSPTEGGGGTQNITVNVVGGMITDNPARAGQILGGWIDQAKKLGTMPGDHTITVHTD